MAGNIFTMFGGHTGDYVNQNVDLCKICWVRSGKCLEAIHSHSPRASETIMSSPENCHAGEMGHCVWTAVDRENKQWFQSSAPNQKSPGRMAKPAKQWPRSPERASQLYRFYSSTGHSEGWHLCGLCLHHRNAAKVNSRVNICWAIILHQACW